jgi:hypothetical protein
MVNTCIRTVCNGIRTNQIQGRRPNPNIRVIGVLNLFSLKLLIIKGIVHN